MGSYVLRFIGLYARKRWVFWLIKFIKPVFTERLNRRIAVELDPNILQRSVGRWDYPRLMISVMCSDVMMRVNVNEHVGFRIWSAGYFDKTLERVAESLNIQGDSIILDIGANIGSVSIPLACKRNCKIIAIEASKEFSRGFLENAILNNVHASIFNAAAVSPDSKRGGGWVRLYRNPGNAGASSVYEDWLPKVVKTNVYEYAKAVVLDELFDLSDIEKMALVKIDVEGSEWDVLKGMEKIVRHGVPILMEYRIDGFTDKMREESSGLIRLLKKRYDFHSVRIDENDQIVIGQFDESKSYENILALPKD